MDMCSCSVSKINPFIIRVNPCLNWSYSFRKCGGIERVQDFFPGHPTSASHRDAVFDIVHRFH